MEMVLACRNHPDVIEGLRYCSRCGQTYCPDCLVTIRGNTFCAACKTEALLDLTSGVDQSTLDLAGVGRRFVALLVDVLILGIPAGIVGIIVAVALASSKSPSPEVFMILWPISFFIYPVYEALMLASRGQTVGKIAAKIKVVRTDGTDLSTGQAWGRAFMRQILAGCLALFNYLPAFLTKDRTCLHDLVANTRVVNWS